MKKQRAYGPNPSLHKDSHLILDAQHPEGHLVTWRSLVTSPEWLLATKGPCVQDAEEGSFYWVDGGTRPLTFFQLDAFVRNQMDYVYFDF